MIGAAIASGGSSEEQFVAFLKQNNINLKEIVSKSFKEQLSSSNTTIRLAKGQADVEVQLQVLFYGIHPAGPFSASVEPMLEVGAEIFIKMASTL